MPAYNLVGLFALLFWQIAMLHLNKSLPSELFIDNLSVNEMTIFIEKKNAHASAPRLISAT